MMMMMMMMKVKFVGRDIYQASCARDHGKQRSDSTESAETRESVHLGNWPRGKGRRCRREAVVPPTSVHRDKL